MTQLIKEKTKKGGVEMEGTEEEIIPAETIRYNLIHNMKKLKHPSFAPAYEPIDVTTEKMKLIEQASFWVENGDKKTIELVELVKNFPV